MRPARAYESALHRVGLAFFASSLDALGNEYAGHAPQEEGGPSSRGFKHAPLRVGDTSDASDSHATADVSDQP